MHGNLLPLLHFCECFKYLVKTKFSSIVPHLLLVSLAKWQQPEGFCEGQSYWVAVTTSLENHSLFLPVLFNQGTTDTVVFICLILICVCVVCVCVLLKNNDLYSRIFLLYSKSTRSQFKGDLGKQVVQFHCQNRRTHLWTQSGYNIMDSWREGLPGIIRRTGLVTAGLLTWVLNDNQKIFLI